MSFHRIARVAVAALLTTVAFSAPKMPTPRAPAQNKSVLFPRIEAAVRSLNIQSISGLDKNGRQLLTIPRTVDGQPLVLNCYASQDDRLAWVVLKLKKISKPNSVSRDNLFRLFIESREFETAYFAYNLDEQRFEIRQPIFRDEFSSGLLQHAIQRVSNQAHLTVSMWDESRW